MGTGQFAESVQGFAFLYEPRGKACSTISISGAQSSGHHVHANQALRFGLCPMRVSTTSDSDASSSAFARCNVCGPRHPRSSDMNVQPASSLPLLSPLY
ncbi:hypothetical protein D3C72_2198360 [compost metagenome]